MILSFVEDRVKGIPKIFSFNTQMIIILDSLNGRKLAFVDLIHKGPWTISFICDFLYFKIKKGFFYLFDYVFKFFSNLQYVLRTYTVLDLYCNYCPTNF